MPLLLIITIICDAVFTYYAASKAIAHGFTIIMDESIVTQCNKRYISSTFDNIYNFALL